MQGAGFEMEYIYFLLLFAPGLALAFYTITDDNFNLFDRILLGVGISLAFYPILFLLGYTLGFPITSPLIYLLIGLSFLGLGWRLYQRRSFLTFLFLKTTALNNRLAGLFLFFVLSLSLYVRIAIAKDLQVPLWADSYHHTMISQLMIDNDGLFSSWSPYAALQTFTYHFSFHSLAASYAWLTGIAIPRSVVVTGQMMNFLAVLGCYLLAKQLTGKQWAGNFAALFAGLISMMPAYYVNWGRYAQLTGLALLPAAIVLVVHLLAQPKPDRKLIFITGFVIAGLGLSHYGVLVFFILFGAILGAYHLLQARTNRARLGEVILTVLQVSLVAGIIASPWLWNFIQGHFLTIVTTIVAQAPGADPKKVQFHNSISNITFYINTHWYLLTIIGSFWAWWRRNWNVVLISIWSISLLILANPDYLLLPGVGLINNFAVFISLFLPFSVILGNLIADLITRAQVRAPWAIYALAAGLLVLGVWGARFRLSLFESQRQFVTRNDLQAIAWIKENVPQEAKFLTNHSFAYNNSLLGVDAGWWLPLLAQRQNLIPPMAFQEVRSLEGVQAAQFFRELEYVDLSNPSGYAFLQDHGVTHIYIGEKQVSLGSEEEPSFLDADSLRNSGLYQEIYQLDHVSILALPDLASDIGVSSED